MTWSQLFGSYRHHQRRVTGHRATSAGTVLRGPVRLVAAAATRCHTVQGHELAPADIVAWRSLRRQLDRQRHARTLGRRFRRHPDAYLRSLNGSSGPSRVCRRRKNVRLYRLDLPAGFPTR